MTMSTEINEKRGRRRRAANPNTEVVETNNEVIEENLEAARGITAKKGYATAGRRNRVQVEEPTGNVVTRSASRPMEYFRNVRAELEKVSWPTWPEALRLMLIVLGVTVVASVVLGLISYGFTVLFSQGLQNPIIFVVFALIAVVIAFFGYRYFKNSSTGGSQPNYPTRL
jgi:preprotein translocase subunit SecE